MEIYNSNLVHQKESSKNKLRNITLGIFLICVVVVILGIRFDQNIRQSTSGSGYSIYGRFMLSLTFLASSSVLVFATTIKNKIIKIILWVIFLPIVIFFLLYLFVLRPHKIIGNSMYPIVVDKEYVLGAPLAYFLKSPKRGDIVIFISPASDNESIDRIVGLPGEKISIKDSKVYINGQILLEPYVTNKFKSADGEIAAEDVLIPDGEYAILGDNRDHSDDSRSYGFVKRSSIKEKIFYAYWPVSKRGFINSN